MRYIPSPGQLPRFVTLGRMRLEVIGRPEYAVAHPLEAATFGNDNGPCAHCALAVRPDTGELVLLWLCGGQYWSLSRETPEYECHLAEIYGRALPLERAAA